MKRIITALAVAAFATTGMAADTGWTGAIDNDWSTAGNWTNGVPGAADAAYINSGTPSITVAPSSITDLHLGGSSGATTVDISADFTVTGKSSVGNGTSGTTINQTAGNVELGTVGASRMWFAEGSSQTTYNLSGGTFSSAGDWDDWGRVAGSSVTFNQTGGTFTDTGNGSLRMGSAAGSVSEINVSGGTFNANNSNTTRIGDKGSATMTLSASAVMNISGTLMVGGQGGSDPASTLNVQDDAVINASSSEFAVGHYDSGTGVMNVSGNAVVNQSGQLYIGRSGTGTLNLSENGAINVSSGDFSVGRWGTGSGTVNMSGGSISLQDSTGTLFVGYDGDGAFYQSGGDIDTGRFRLCDDPNRGESGFYSISGGTLQVSEYISTGYDGVFEVYGSGATLIEASALSVGGDADTMRFVLDENGSTLVTIDSLINPLQSGQASLGNGLIELDTTGTFDGTLGTVYDLLWASDGINTDSNTVFSVLSATDFEMSILEGVDQFGNAGSGSMLQVTVIPEPTTISLLGFCGLAMLWTRRRSRN